MIKFQCDYCLEILKFPDQLTGRRLLCPLCGNSLNVPPPGATKAFKKQALDFLISRCQLSDWDREFAKTLLTRRLVDDSTLRTGIMATIKAGRKGPPSSLADQLAAAGKLSKADREAVRDQVRTKVGTVETKFIECPNCFANVPARDPACKFCGQRLGAAADRAICPNCKHEQDRGPVRCRRCQADMRTGLLPNQAACVHCGKPLKGAADKCPHCRQAQRSARPTRSRRFSGRRMLALAAGGAVAAVVIGLLLYPTLHFWLRRLTVGAPRAELELRLDEFRAVLQSGALDRLGACLDPEAHAAPTAELRLRLLAGSQPPGALKRVEKIDLAGLEVAADGRSARVRLATRLELLPAAGGEVGDELLAAQAKLARGTEQDFTVESNWRRGAGGWRCLPPGFAPAEP